MGERFVKEQGAKKEYHCSAGCGDMIKVGERYKRITHKVDASSEYEKEFYVERFHLGCVGGVGL